MNAKSPLGRIVAVVSLLLSLSTLAGEKISIASWNVGHFSRGLSVDSFVPTAEVDSWALAYRDFIKETNARIFFVSEYSPYLDTNKTVRTPSAVFRDYGTAYESPLEGGHVNSLFIKGLESSPSEIISYSHRYQKTHFNWTRVKIGGYETIVVATHLEPNFPTDQAEVRARQLRQLIENFRDYPRVIIGADWNFAVPSENAPLLEAGFTMANGGRIATWPSDSPRSPIDDFAVKGFEISNFRKMAAPKLSDHCLVTCEIEVMDTRPIPDLHPRRYNSYLPAQETVVWKDRRLSEIDSFRAYMGGPWFSVLHQARGIIYDRTENSMKVQFQSLDGHCKVLRARFRQQGEDIVGAVEAAGFSEGDAYGTLLPVSKFVLPPATSPTNGTYGVYRIEAASF